MSRPRFRTTLAVSLAIWVLLPEVGAAQEYQPADQSQRTARGGTEILPEQFLRGFDPVTAYFPDNVSGGAGPADDGDKLLKISPPWPGAWFWADRKTLQFRPAEAWPALSRFAFNARGTQRVLTTLMSAPAAMSPAPDSDGLRPFRSFTLTFPQPLPISALRSMLSLEVRDAPGLGDSPVQRLKDFTLTQLPRGSHRDPAVYAVTWADDIPEGKQLLVRVSLGLGDVGKVLWTARLSTRMPFHLESVSCGASRLPVFGAGAVPRELAMSCGNQGETPQLVFSAPVKELTLTALRKLVRLEPSVPDLHFQVYGSRVSLLGRFVPDVLYRLQLGAAPLQDDSGRSLQDPGALQLYFHLGWKTPFLRFGQSTAVLEANGPRMVPLTGYGDPRADVRLYRVDPLHPGLWPFPSSPVVVQEETSPPFPGEEPPPPPEATGGAPLEQLVAHVRLLGSPLVSRIVDLPLAERSGTTRFGLDLAPLLDPALGKNRPGTYLVGLRRLQGAPERVYMRVQITNLSLSAAEERERSVFFVRTLDQGQPVRGAQIILEGMRKGTPSPNQPSPPDVAFKETLTTDGDGRANVALQPSWVSVKRVSVRKDEDTLVLDTNEAPPRFANNHWSPSDGWLSWLNQTPPATENEGPIGFLFTERGIYRPGEPVFLKGYARQRKAGELQAPGDARGYGLEISGPDGQTFGLPLRFTPLGGFAATFQEKDVPSGDYTATLFRKGPGPQDKQAFATRSFKVEAYRIPTFEVQLSGASQVSLDAPFQVKALARYYAGGTVAGQPISWRVVRRPHHHVPAGRPGFLFASSTQFARPGLSRAQDTIRKEATLDAGGAAEMSVNPALDLDGSARLYRFEATVTGPDNQQVAAVLETRALPPFVMGLKVPRFVERPGELKPKIIAVGPDDKLKAGQDLTLTLYRRVWHSQLRESAFATGEAKYVTEQEDVKLLEKPVRTGDQEVTPALTLKEAGVYVVELTARDKLGRVQTLSADLYVGGDQPVTWNKSRQGVFEVALDKNEYRPGEVAHLVVQSPFQSGQALIVEEDLAGNRYTWRPVSGGKAVHDIVVQARHVPNLPIHVLLIRGRLGEGKTDDSRYRPASLGASTILRVSPTQNLVKLNVEHPESARPGATVDVTLVLQDDAQRPLAGEVTLWLVDEAVLSLAKEDSLDPLSTLIRPNQASVTLRDTRNLIAGRIAEQEESPGGDGGMELDEAAGGRPVVRKNFKTVPFYEATVEVPASGRRTIKVKLSDDLTNFRVRAVAASGWQRFGVKQSTLRVRLPVLVQPQLPRFVRQGDRFWGGALGRVVEGEDGPARLTLELKGPAKAETREATAALTKLKPESFLTPIEVSTSAGTAPTELTVRASVVRQKDNEGDAFEVKLPVLPDQPPETFAYFASLADGKSTLRPPAEPARPGTLHQEVVLASVPGVLPFAAGLEYLAEYPYGCLEQRMSQLAPDLQLAGMLKTLDLPTRFTPQLARFVQSVVSDLGLYQDDRGLLAFWPGGPGDVQLTAQAVEFLTAARSAGLPLDEAAEKARGRAIEALQRILRSDVGASASACRFTQQTQALVALGKAQKLDEHYWVELFHQRARMDVASRADLALAGTLKPAAFRTNLETLKDELWDSVVIQLNKGQPTFAGLKYERKGWDGCLGSPVSAVSAVFEGLLSLDPKDKRHTVLRDGLIAEGSAELGFGSTHDNRRALAALSAYLTRGSETGKKARVELSGLPPVELSDARKGGRRTVNRDTPLEAAVTGGPIDARVSYRYVPAAPADRIKAKAQGLVVSRSFTQIREGAAETHGEDQSGAVRKVASGDLWELHTKLVSNEERTHVALVVPFAAGFEPLNPALETSGASARPSQSDSLQPAYVQRLDHETRYFFLRLPRGTHSFHLRVRATTEGSFVHPAPYAEGMYRPEVRGRGDGMRVVITGGHER